VDLLEEARALEGHLRLQHLERCLLAAEGGAGTDDLALRLLGFATSGGMRSLGLPGGDLAPGHPADFSVVSLEDPSIAGASAGDLATQLVFSGARTAVRDVYVAGEPIVTHGVSSPGRPDAVDVVADFRRTMAKLWGG
jgi:formimidoylglutamate deiminase